MGLLTAALETVGTEALTLRTTWQRLPDSAWDLHSII